MDLKKLTREIRGYEGVKRKSGIGDVISALGIEAGSREGGFDLDDAAVLELGGRTLLFAGDSISEGLIEADPYFAGYSAVLVNVNDVAAMGGRPVAMVNALSAKDGDTAHEIARGVGDASSKFGVPIVGGHFNPNSSHNGIEVSIIGESVGGSVIRGTAAKADEAILVAVDIEGALHPSYSYAWDSTSKKSPEKVQKDLELLEALAQERIVGSGRDISNPGIIGTLGMLLEGSNAGGVVELEKIPHPGGIELSHWLKVYPGFGFVFTAEESNVNRILTAFHDRGIAAEAVGWVRRTKKLLISWGGREEMVFDFEKESITGV